MLFNGIVSIWFIRVISPYYYFLNVMSQNLGSLPPLLMCDVIYGWPLTVKEVLVRKHAGVTISSARQSFSIAGFLRQSKSINKLTKKKEENQKCVLTACKGATIINYIATNW